MPNTMHKLNDVFVTLNNRTVKIEPIVLRSALQAIKLSRAKTIGKKTFPLVEQLEDYNQLRDRMNGVKQSSELEPYPVTETTMWRIFAVYAELNGENDAN